MGPLLVSSGDPMPRRIPAGVDVASMGPLLVSSGDLAKTFVARQVCAASMGPLLVSSGDVITQADYDLLPGVLQWGRCW